MKIASVFTFLTLTLLLSCTPQQKVDNKTLYVSILPLRTLVSQIVGEDFNIEVLVPAGASPETFEPTAKQFIGLNEAQLVFNVGLIDFENNLLSKVADTAKVVNLSHGIDLIAGSCSHCVDGKHHAHGIDPHVWTSPRELQIMATNAYNAIQHTWPDSTQYGRNYEALMARLQTLDTSIAERITAAQIKYFIIYHPALTYYARAYGLEQLAIENEGKEPSAKRLSQIINRARRDGVHRIFYQKQFPASTVEIIARDIDANYVEIDPLHEDIIANIQNITDLIVTQ
ncbi:MAG: zinc ABC transporter substrate-binding protein [Alistipes sp.]